MHDLQRWPALYAERHSFGQCCDSSWRAGDGGDRCRVPTQSACSTAIANSRPCTICSTRPSRVRAVCCSCRGGGNREDRSRSRRLPGCARPGDAGAVRSWRRARDRSGVRRGPRIAGAGGSRRRPGSARRALRRGRGARRAGSGGAAVGRPPAGCARFRGPARALLVHCGPRCRRAAAGRRRRCALVRPAIAAVHRPPGPSDRLWRRPGHVGYPEPVALSVDLTSRPRAAARRSEAVGVAAEAVRLARQWNVPFALAEALRAAGLATGGADGLERLREAVAVAATGESTLEQARALGALGGALRRAGSRQAARGPLRDALDRAAHSGADAVVGGIHEELVATGAQPRRLRSTGVDALTHAERRVAGMAAGGGTNRAIAEALFVSEKTVETHLHRAYRSSVSAPARRSRVRSPCRTGGPPDQRQPRTSWSPTPGSPGAGQRRACAGPVRSTRSRTTRSRSVSGSSRSRTSSTTRPSSS